MSFIVLSKDRLICTNSHKNRIECSILIFVFKKCFARRTYEKKASIEKYCILWNILVAKSRPVQVEDGVGVPGWPRQRPRSILVGGGWPLVLGETGTAQFSVPRSELALAQRTSTTAQKALRYRIRTFIWFCPLSKLVRGKLSYRRYYQAAPVIIW